MNTDNLAHFGEKMLADLTEDLHSQYYTQLERMMLKAEEYAQQLKETDIHNTLHQYIDACRRLLYELNVFLQHRRCVLTPYIKELVVKHAEGHDCSTCAGACNVGHNAHVSEIQLSHSRMKELLYNIEKITLQCNVHTECSAKYSLLNAEMRLIDTSLSELFYVEEMNLLRKIFEEQQFIHIRK